MRFILFGMYALGLTACGEHETDVSPIVIAETQAPPPMPENVETVTFERAPTVVVQSSAQDVAEPAVPEASTESAASLFWGVEEGGAVPILWEDLMPEGSEEELIRQYEEFYAMLEKRYAAETTLLSQADPYGGIAEGSDLDFMPQLGTFDVVDELNGQRVRIPGYVVPFDFSTNARHEEFLFVPYMGACIHSPPPPPNQLILARADPTIRVDDIWAPYWLEGTLHTESTENELGDTAYTMTMDELEPYMME